MTRVSVATYEQEDTEKIHIVSLAFPPSMWHSHCSFRRRFRPTEREIELTDDMVCETCAKSYREEKGIEQPTSDSPTTADEEVESESAPDPTPTSESKNTQTQPTTAAEGGESSEETVQTTLSAIE